MFLLSQDFRPATAVVMVPRTTIQEHELQYFCPTQCLSPLTYRRRTGTKTDLDSGRCLRSVGIGLAPSQLREMVKAMDSHGDGLIPTAPILEFLQEEAGASSRQAGRAEEKVRRFFRKSSRGLRSRLMVILADVLELGWSMFHCSRTYCSSIGSWGSTAESAGNCPFHGTKRTTLRRPLASRLERCGSERTAISKLHALPGVRFRE